MGSGRTVAVFGAYGHTGRFVVAELRERGFVPVLLRPRRRQAAGAGGSPHPGLEARPASVDDPASLDRALAGAAAVINCAGPFATTAAPVIEAALRAGIPYVDVAAEIEANLDTFAHFADRARAAGAVVVPAMAFYGGLGDLLATAAMGDWTAADEAHIAYGLSSWHPTAGTRTAGAVSRRAARRPPRPLHGRAAGVPRRRPADPGVALPRPDGPPGGHRGVHDGRRRHRPQPPVHPRGAHLHDGRGGQGPLGPGHAGAGRGRRARPVRPDLPRRRRRALRRHANGAPWPAARTSTPSARRSRWRRSTASSPAGPGRSASPPPARSSTRPTSSARCPRTSPWTCLHNSTFVPGAHRSPGQGVRHHSLRTFSAT